MSMTALPAAGRVGPAPEWPLPPEVRLRASLGMATDKAEQLRDQWSAAADPKEARSLARQLEAAELHVKTVEMQIELASSGEQQLWEQIWSTPQAEAWERMLWTREVAQYVRWKVKAEGGDLEASKEARQLGDRLGLTPLSMLRLRWEISGPAAEAPAQGNVVELFG